MSTMRSGRTYLIVLGLLSVLAQIPIVVFSVAILTFGAGGALLIASPTILLYSLAVLLVWPEPDEPRRGSWIVCACLVAAAVAIGPGALSHIAADRYGVHASLDDFARPGFGKPTTIEIVSDEISGVFQYGQDAGDKRAACSEVCRRLLFNREVERVRMAKVAAAPNDPRPPAAWSVTYRIEQRESCPQAYPAGTQIDKAFRDRLVAGDCLIAETESDGRMDATVSLTTLHHWQRDPVPPGEAPRLATVQMLKRLLIEQRGEDGTAAQIALRHETTASTVALPFYFGYQLQGGDVGQTIGQRVHVINPVDLAQALRDAFGFKVAPVEPPAPEDPSKLADRILSPPTTPNLSAQQQESVYDVVAGMSAQPSLSDGDIDFVRRVIADPRVTEGRLGGAFLGMFRKHRARLEPLLPVVIERLEIPVPERIGHYQNSLGWAAAEYPTEALLPYREQIVAIVEAQNEWPTTGLLSRVGELGGDTSDLIVRRLDANSDTVRQFAAVAACRASDDIWTKVEPVALAHLEAAAEINRLQDEDRKLILGFIRHGKRSVIAELIANGYKQDRPQMMRIQSSRLEVGFTPDHCRDLL
jgi:hypothetical protein